MEQYGLTGEMIAMPLIDHCGYERTLKSRFLGKHKHEGPEIVFLVEGSMVWNFSKNKSIMQKGNTFHILAAGDSHWPDNNLQTPCKQAWLVCNKYSKMSHTNTTLSPELIIEITSQFNANSGQMYKMDAQILESVKRFINLSKALKIKPNNEYEKARIRNSVCQLLLDTYKYLTGDKIMSDQTVIFEAKQYLEKNYQKPVPMEQLAKHLGYTSTWILKVFTREEGVPPGQYLQRYRIEKAKEVLKKSNLTITKTALENGFSNSQYFSQVFKKYTGMSAKEYRKQSY